MENKPVRTILFLAANPSNSTQLRLGEEARDIEEGLVRSQQREQFKLEQKWAVRPKDIQRAMLDLSPQFVHFSGHGMGTETAGDSAEAGRKMVAEVENPAPLEGLVFENETGQAQLVSKEALAGLFELFSGRLECVLLNACYSEIQAEAIAAHIPYVIGMNRAIGDKAARIFAVGFYDALGAGKDIEFAYKFACNSIRMEGIPEHLTPVLKRQLDLAPSPVTTSSDKDNVKTILYNGRPYVVLEKIEQRCQEEITKNGALIRIKSPDKMGKSLMLGRILDHVSQIGYRTVIVDLREANQDTFENINNFLQWLCFYVSDLLEIDQDPSQTWKSFLGANPNCTKYFENYLLAPIDSPLVLAIDNFDCIFEHPKISEDFYGLLRGWFEKVNTRPVWGKLRQIIAYPKELYATKNINQSPFNVGLSIELEELDTSQIVIFAQACGVSWSMKEAQKLAAMIGGHPYLVQQTLDKIAHSTLTLEQILTIAPTEEGIYGDFLRDRLLELESNPDLITAMQSLVNSDRPVRLSAKDSFQLDSMGLTCPQDSNRILRCELYRLYFRDRLR